MDRRDVKLSVPRKLADHARAAVIDISDAAVEEIASAMPKSQARLLARSIHEACVRSFLAGFLDWPMNHEGTTQAETRKGRAPGSADSPAR